MILAVLRLAETRRYVVIQLNKRGKGTGKGHPVLGRWSGKGRTDLASRTAATLARSPGSRILGNSEERPAPTGRRHQLRAPCFGNRSRTGALSLWHERHVSKVYVTRGRPYRPVYVDDGTQMSRTHPPQQVRSR